MERRSPLLSVSEPEYLIFTASSKCSGYFIRDHLKIEHGFVRDILTDTSDSASAKMIIALSETESRGRKVIAEAWADAEKFTWAAMLAGDICVAARY